MRNHSVKCPRKLVVMLGVPLLSFAMMGQNSSLGFESDPDLSHVVQVNDEGFGREDGRVKSPLGFASDPGFPTDGQIEGAIKRRLEMDSRIPAEKVGVTVKNHKATLFGTVDTIKDKKLSTLVAGSVRGVSAVENDLRVRPSLSRDEKIKRDVEQVINPIELKQGDRLKVMVEKGVVTLVGEALDHQDVRRAGNAVEGVPGVIKIINMIRVIKKNRPDSAIEKDVISYLISSPLVNTDNFDVEVKDGVVSLEGTVKHLTYRDALRIDIENIEGVKEVKVGKVIPERFTASVSEE